MLQVGATEEEEEEEGTRRFYRVLTMVYNTQNYWGTPQLGYALLLY
jgi:hypothetical protein